MYVCKSISEEFLTVWNFPHCIGAIDGKHIAIECPSNTGSLYHNYKGFFSVVLMAICDARYTFTLINIGDYGSNNDSGVLGNSEIGKALASNTLGVPDPETFEGFEKPLPYYLVGDDIFGLQIWLQRSYPRSRNPSEDPRLKQLLP